MYLDQVPTSSELKKIYPKNYYSNNDKSSIVVEYFRNILERKKIKSLIKLTEQKKNLNILDLGSGDGRLLKLFKRFSSSANSYFGIELLNDNKNQQMNKEFTIVNDNVEGLSFRHLKFLFPVVVDINPFGSSSSNGASLITRISSPFIS